MRPFLIKVICFVILQAAIFLPLANYGANHKSRHHYLATLKDKVQLLKDAPGPRIIFLGGSNLAFGLDSPQIAAKTGLHPVNLGLHASFGLNPLFRMVKKHLQPGDLIVLSPEYEVFAGNIACQPEIAAETFNVWPGCREFLQPDIDQQLTPLARPPLRQFADCVSNARRRFANKSDKVKSIYSRQSFNQYGDLVGHHGSNKQSDPKNFNRIKLITDQKLVLPAISKLNNFISHCRSAGASVVFAHAPIPAEDLNSQTAEAVIFENTLRQQLTCPIITSVDQLAFESEYLFDTEYHLTQAGGQKRTATFCKLLIQHQQRQANANEKNIQ